MSSLPLGFVDRSIPGLSARDIAWRAVDAVQQVFREGDRASRHRDFVVRHDLARLDRETLRDVGLDRDRA